MTGPRRRLLRSPGSVVSDPRTQRRLERYHQHLESERQSLARWMSRLKRAFHAVEKSQQRLSRLERAIARLAPE